MSVLATIAGGAKTITARFRAVAKERKTVKSVETFESGLLPCLKCGAHFRLADAPPLSMAQCPRCNDLLFFPMKLLNVWLIEPLGAGGFGSVYMGRLADHPDQRVTVKLLRDSSADERAFRSFVAECQVASAIPRHPNIPDVYAHSTDDGLAFLVMEYVEGTRLDHLVDTDGRIADEEALYYAFDLTNALEHILDSGYLHRDVKPQNVIVTPSGVAKLIDMGSCVSAEEVARPASTGTSIEGTPLFLTPERCRREGEDHRGDIYALGLLLYFAVTGSSYIVPTDVPDIIKQHTTKLKVPVGVNMHGNDQRVVNLVQAMVRRNPDNRPQTYEELRQAITNAIAGYLSHPAANERAAARRRLLRVAS